MSEPTWAVRCGASDRVLRKWASSGFRPECYDRLWELRDVALLSRTRRRRAARAFAPRRNRPLRDVQPLELLSKARPKSPASRPDRRQVFVRP
jgi:hypothetical protein